MKRILFPIVLAVVLLSLCSCKSDKKQVNVERESAITTTDVFSSNDSAEVFSMLNDLVTRLNNGDLEGAVGKISFLQGDSIIPLPKELRKRQMRALTSSHGIRYELEKLQFDSEKDNLARIKIILFDKTGPEDHRPNEISLFVKPIRRDGKWFLTSADTMTDTNMLHGTQIKN